MPKKTLHRRIEIERAAATGDGPRHYPVTVSTDTPIERWELGERYLEVLDHKPAAIDLSRAPLPVIESHDRSRINIGVVRNLKTDGHRLRGELVLGTTARAKELAADIDAEIVTGVSVGLSATKVDRVGETETVRRWTPFEVSITAVPADIRAGINRSFTMDDDDDLNPTDDNDDDQLTPEQRQRAAEQRTREVERITAINRMVTRAGAPAELATRAIRQRMTVDQTRELVIGHFADNDVHHNPPSDDPVRGRVDAYEGPRDNFTRAASDAILLRAGIPVAKPHAAAADLRTMSVVDLARAYLSQNGERTTQITNVGVVKRAMATSDFPLILTNTVGAAIRNGYETEPASHRAWTREQLVPDFKEQKRPILGSAPALLTVLEKGEYQDGSLEEDSASYSVTKFGRIVSLSWETLVNDSLGAFLRLQPAMGQAARRLEADVVYALITANSGAGVAMQDGNNLFDLSNHGNVTASGAMDIITLGLARLLLRKQTALGGGYLALVPKFLIVPAELETAAEVTIATASRHVNTTLDTGVTTGIAEHAPPNWISALEIVVEPRLPATSYYLAADTAQIDTIEVGKLDDDGGVPVIEEERGFRKDEMSWKIRHVVGAKPLDWRGLVRCPVS